MEPPSTFGLGLQVVALLVLYDFLFYWGHRAMHRWPQLYQRVHKEHHQQIGQRSTALHSLTHPLPLSMRHADGAHPRRPACVTVTRAFDTIRLTYAEQLVDVGCSILAVNLLGAHPLARALYDVIVVYLLCELHCG